MEVLANWVEANVLPNGVKAFPIEMEVLAKNGVEVSIGVHPAQHSAGSKEDGHVVDHVTNEGAVRGGGANNGVEARGGGK